MREGYRLGDHCLKIGSGATPRGGKETYLEEGPVALIRSQNIHNDRFSFAGLAYISEHQATQLRNVAVETGDVLLNITGDSVARVCQVDPRMGPARVNQHVAIIRPDPDVIDPQYLRYYLVTPSFQAHMLSLAASGATRNALTKGMIEEFRVPRVPIYEQRAIASILGALDDKIDLNRRMNETLEAMARALFKDWFVDFGPTRAKMGGRAPYLAPDLWALFPKRLDDEEKPEGWEERHASDLCHVAIGRTPPRKEKEHFLPGGQGLPWLSIKTMGSGDAYIFDTAEDLSDDAVERFRIPKVKAGTVMVSFKLTVGRVAIAGRDMYTNEAIAQFEMPTGSLISSEFLYCALKSFDFTTLGSTSSIATAVNSQSIKSIPIVLPHALVLRAFDDVVHPLLQRVKANIAESRTLAETRDLLLPKLMSGEIRVCEAEQMVEDVA